MTIKTTVIICSMSEVRRNLDIVELVRGDSTTCAVNLHGATVVSWKVFNTEQLFVSSASRFDNLYPIRGGVSVLFAQIGYDKIYMPHNGFARTRHWTVEKKPTVIRGGDVEAVFGLKNDSTVSRNYWPYEFVLRCLVVLHERSISLKLSVYNAEDRPIEINVGFMNYIKLQKASKCELVGFLGSNFVNTITKKMINEIRPKFKIDHWIDSIYVDVKGKVELINTVAPFSMTIRRYELPDVSVWNPWYDMAKYVTNFTESEVEEMVVMTVGNIVTPRIIQPMSWHSVTQDLDITLNLNTELS